MAQGNSSAPGDFWSPGALLSYSWQTALSSDNCPQTQHRIRSFQSMARVCVREPGQVGPRSAGHQRCAASHARRGVGLVAWPCSLQGPPARECPGTQTPTRLAKVRKESKSPCVLHFQSRGPNSHLRRKHIGECFSLQKHFSIWVHVHSVCPGPGSLHILQANFFMLCHTASRCQGNTHWRQFVYCCLGCRESPGCCFNLHSSGFLWPLSSPGNAASRVGSRFPLSAASWSDLSVTIPQSSKQQ